MPESREQQLGLERARVRDLLRYYKPNVKRSQFVSNGSLLETCDEPHAASDAPPPTVAVAAEAADDSPDESALLAHDPTLTAFAQLGESFFLIQTAFRLNCERSFISLMDHENQYILAEATRSVSLNDQKVTGKGDEVYLGARVLDMAWGVCPNTIQVFTSKDGSLNVETDLVVANPECYVMSDMSAIERYKSRPYVSGWPYMKFYAEVPIHSPTGHVIGTYCVVDNKPRDALDKKGRDALNEIASAIMKHLELIQMQHNLQRAGEMVKGLSKFVEGKSSQSHQWSDDEASDLGALQGRPGMHRTGTAKTLSEQSERRPNLQETTNHTSIPNSSSPEPTTPTFAPVPSSQTSKGSSSSDTIARSRERKMSTSDGAVTQESLASTGTKQLFSRACFLIREALDLDGILFVDAFFRDIAVDPAKSVPRPNSPETLRFRGIPNTPSHDTGEWLENGGSPTRVTTNAPQGHNSANKRPELPNRSTSSEILEYSAERVSVLGGLSSLSKHVSLPQSTLRGLLQKYRHGHTFVFDEDGAIVLGSEDSNCGNLIESVDGISDVELGPGKEKIWIKQLLQVCPGARSIIFFPLWDPQRDQWFAGSLAWTTDPTRIIQSADVTYLAAFGSCIMSEKSRLDALTADRAKADFISSVSHELRSPLHGVLASAEALQETSSGTIQDDMIRTIMICGEALLDTMDQILDYAKTSNSADVLSAKLKQKAESKSPKVASLDLSNLVETVVEGIFVGHNYRKVAFGSLEGERRSNGQDSKSIEVHTNDVMIILSIAWDDSWFIESQRGGWKRIIMNLFGNALKYTQSGFVHVSLDARHNPATATLPAQRVFALQIDDSGKGMSREYLKYKLYTPFAQEDEKSVGTGLGLSIVRQLVSDLGGKIDIQSEVSYGTTVKVSVPLDSQPLMVADEITPSDAFLPDIKRRCKGLRLCLIGFEFYPEIGENPTGILSPHARRMLALKSSLVIIGADWFGMEISTADSLASARGDFLVGLRSKIDVPKGHVQKDALILFEDIIGGGRSYEAEGVYRLSQPAGPHKMARMLALCLDWNSSVTERAGTNNAISKTDAVSLDAVLEEVSALGLTDRHPTDLLEDTPAEIDQTQLLPPSTPKFPGQKVEGSAAEKMVLTIPHNRLVAESTPPRWKVLLVEDNAINMKILVHYMQRTNQDYVTAANGLEALQKFQAAPISFKVIFMDLSMPVMDGLTSSRHIRKFELDNSLPRTRIVALTCFSSPEYQRDAALSGVDMFLIKPVPMKTLKPILDLDLESFPQGCETTL